LLTQSLQELRPSRNYIFKTADEISGLIESIMVRAADLAMLDKARSIL
jgi:hypothetical protein